MYEYVCILLEHDPFKIWFKFKYLNWEGHGGSTHFKCLRKEIPQILGDKTGWWECQVWVAWSFQLKV